MDEFKKKGSTDPRGGYDKCKIKSNSPMNFLTEAAILGVNLITTGGRIY